MRAVASQLPQFPLKQTHILAADHRLRPNRNVTLLATPRDASDNAQIPCQRKPEPRNFPGQYWAVPVRTLLWIQHWHSQCHTHAQVSDRVRRRDYTVTVSSRGRGLNENSTSLMRMKAGVSR